MASYTKTSNQRDEAHSLVRLFNAFSLAAEHQLSVASVLALAQIAIQTLNQGQPRFATPTDVARALNMSLSAVVRLLAKLAEPGGPEFLVSDSSWWPGRSDAYALTAAGQEFVSKLLAISRSAEQEGAPLTSLAEFETTKRHPHEPLHKLKQTEWDNEHYELRLEAVDPALFDLVKSWIVENIGQNTKIEHLNGEISIKFPTPNDAVWFKLRWC